MCDRCETVCVSLPVWLCMRLYDCGNTPEHPGSSFPSPPTPHSLPSSQLTATQSPCLPGNHSGKLTPGKTAGCL